MKRSLILLLALSLVMVAGASAALIDGLQLSMDWDSNMTTVNYATTNYTNFTYQNGSIIPTVCAGGFSGNAMCIPGNASISTQGKYNMSVRTTAGQFPTNNRLTIQLWTKINRSTTVSGTLALFGFNGVGTNVFETGITGYNGTFNTTGFNMYCYDGVGSYCDTYTANNTVINSNGTAWVMITSILDNASGRTLFYLNNGLIANLTGTVRSQRGNFTLGSATSGMSGADSINATFDQLKIWNRALNLSEINSTYNAGLGCTTSQLQNSDCLTNTTITASNRYNSTTILSFNATVTWNGTTTNYTTTTGTIIIPGLFNSTLPANVTITANQYFSNTTLNNTAPTLSALLTPWTIVRAVSIPTSSAVTTFTLNYTNNANSSESGVTTTTNGVIWIPLFNATYTVRIYDASNSSTSFASDEATLTASPYLHSYNYSLYLTNSFFIRFVNEETGLVINTTTVTAYFSGSAASYNYTTTTGYLNATVLNPQNYTITYLATGYDQREYYIELSNQTYQTLTLYLSNSSGSSLVLVSVVDTASAKVEDAIIYLNRKNLSGTNYYTVETCVTDANGECLINPTLYTVTYNILVSYEGTTRYESGDTKISQTSLLFVINRGEQTLESYYEIANIEATLTTTKAVNDTVAVWSATYTNPGLTGQAFMLQINGITEGVRTQLYAINGTGASGTLTYNTTITTAYDELEARLYYIDAEGEYVLLQSSSIVTGSFEQRMGRLGLFLFGFLFVGVIAFATMGTGITAFIFSIPLVFTVMNMVGIGALGWGTIAVMWVMAGIVWGLIKK